MKVFIDTNIILDYLADRSPYSGHAEQIFNLCIQGRAEGYITASSATDIYYLMNKVIGQQKTRAGLEMIFSLLNVASVAKSDLKKAMELSMTDFEDALVAVCAKRVGAEYIVTRDEKGFNGSPVPPITPWNLLKALSGKLDAQNAFMLSVMTDEVVASSKIEGVILDKALVRSSLAKKFGFETAD